MILTVCFYIIFQKYVLYIENQEENSLESIAASSPDIRQMLMILVLMCSNACLLVKA